MCVLFSANRTFYGYRKCCVYNKEPIFYLYVSSVSSVYVCVRTMMLAWFITYQNERRKKIVNITSARFMALYCVYVRKSI